MNRAGAQIGEHLHAFAQGEQPLFRAAGGFDRVHFGPPTLPISTASAALQAASVSSVSGTPNASMDAPAEFALVKIEFMAVFGRDGLKHLDRLRDDFRADVIAGRVTIFAFMAYAFPAIFSRTKFSMPPTAIIFWMNGGNGAAVKLSPVVLSSITPVSRFTATSSPSRMAFAARGALDDRQADIDGVAVENPGKAVRDDELNAAGLDGDRRMLAGRTAPKLRPATMMRLVSLFFLKSLSRSSIQWEASSA